MSHNSELPPPGLFDPIMDEASLACRRDSYTLPVRTPEEWIHGDDLWYPEREIMYGMAKQKLRQQGYDREQSDIALLVTQDVNNQRLGRILGVDKSIVTGVIEGMFADKLRHPTKAAITNHVVRTGLRQLVLRSLVKRAPHATLHEQRKEAWRLLDERIKNRIHSFGFTTGETKISLLILDGLSNDAIGKQVHAATDTISQYVVGINVKADCHSRNQFIHRMYGAAAPRSFATPIVDDQL